VVGSEPGPSKERRVSLTAEEHPSRPCPFSAEGVRSRGPAASLGLFSRSCRETLPDVDSRLALALWSSSRACARQSRESPLPDRWSPVGCQGRKVQGGQEMHRSAGGSSESIKNRGTGVCRRWGGGERPRRGEDSSGRTAAAASEGTTGGRAAPWRPVRSAGMSSCVGRLAGGQEEARMGSARQVTDVRLGLGRQVRTRQAAGETDRAFLLNEGQIVLAGS
jgi:hypothetical protein